MSGTRMLEYTVKRTRTVQITLPKTYAQDAGIKAGDVIEVIQTSDGRLVLQPKGWKPRTEGTQVQMGAVV